MTGGLQIRLAADADASDWGAYVDAAPGATFFHCFAWRGVIRDVYGYSSCYLMARREGRVVGVLPLIDVRSPLLGRNLISTAFTVGGGVVADDPAAQAALIEAASEEGRKRRVGYIELRSALACVDGWAVKNDVYAGFERQFAADEEANLKELPRRRRAEVRKGLAALGEGRLRVTFDSDVDVFYRLYSSAMRNLGTPIYPRSFARIVMQAFGNDAEILTIWADEHPVLSLMSFYFRDRVMPYYFGARPDAREHRAYDLSIWLQMRRAAERGSRIFDFGRSKFGTGSFDHKVYWGFEPKPLEYQYKLIGARRTPNVSPSNPKFSAASAAWRRLPLPVANLAGPMLARHLA
jgi:FemAB-related protein (PEP-CTERM system-associated)